MSDVVELGPLTFIKAWPWAIMKVGETELALSTTQARLVEKLVVAYSSGGPTARVHRDVLIACLPRVRTAEALKALLGNLRSKIADTLGPWVALGLGNSEGYQLVIRPDGICPTCGCRQSLDVKAD